MRGIHRSPINSSHKGQWRGALMCYFISAWTSSWANNGKAGDLRRHRAHYDVRVMRIDHLACHIWPTIPAISCALTKSSTIKSSNIPTNSRDPKLCKTLPELPFYTESKMSSFWWNLHHWLHWKLSKWQLSVQPVMKISSKWQHFRFSVLGVQINHSFKNFMATSNFESFWVDIINIKVHKYFALYLLRTRSTIHNKWIETHAKGKEK